MLFHQACMWALESPSCVLAGPQKLDDSSKRVVADGLARAAAHMGPTRSKEAALLLTQPFVHRAQAALASGAATRLWVVSGACAFL